MLMSFALMKTPSPALLVAAALAAIFFATTVGAAESEVAMIPASGELQPSTTLEFRFPDPVVKPDEIGPAEQSPIVFQPDLPGNFTWLSTRSGVFSPRGPLPLGTTWRVTLREGIPGEFAANVVTPPFAVTKVSGNVGEKAEVSPKVGVSLAFNLPVALDPAFFAFRNAAGNEVPAAIRPVGPDDYFQVEPDAEDWNLRWKLANDPNAEVSAEPTTARVVVTPASPLPVSAGWRLTIKQGLPSADGSAALPASLEIPVGEVPAFGIRNTECRNYVNSGPTATVNFSDSLAPDINDETAGKFFTVTPAVADLEWEIVYDAVVVRGAFELGKEYNLRVGEGVVSGEGQPFDGARDVRLSFAPVPPRLYLPELTMSQILGGRRILPVRSVNLASLRVRAVLLSPDQAARALSVFEENRWKYSNEEPVPTDNFSGKTVSDETIAVNEALVDKRATTDLDWSRILGDKKSGIVYLEITGDPLAEVGGKQCAAQALIQLTDLGVLWSKAGNDLGTFVFSTATGQPVRGARLQWLDEKFASFARAQTDEEGSAKIAYGTVPRWLVVQTDTDASVIPMGPGAPTLPMGAWYSSWQTGRDSTADLRGAIFTDRPLYQPGETVRIKGYLRNVGEDGLAFAEGVDLELSLYDPENDIVANSTARTDKHGAFDSAVTIPAGSLGNYRIGAATGDSSLAAASVLVAEYQPDAFEVDVDLPADFPAGSPAPSASVTGRYFFGGRLTDAEVRWSLRYFQSSFAPPGFEKFSFLDLAAEDDNESGKPLTLRGEGRMAKDKPLEIRPVLPAPALAPFRGVLTAEVTDINQQTVSSTAEFTRESSDFYLGVSRGEADVVALGSEVPLQIVAVRPDGQPVDRPVEVKVDIRRWRHHVVREQGAGGAMTFRTEKIEEPVFAETVRTLVPAKAADGWSVGASRSALFKPAALGHHRIRVTAKDAGGREVATESSFYVSGDGDTVWDYRNPYAVDLVPDKTSYRAGETAKILVKTPIAGDAIVNLQRGDSILRTMRFPISGNAPCLEIPLAADDAPNITVSLVILRGADKSPRKFPVPEFRFGSCELSIEQPERVLKVSVETEKARVQPGDDVACAIEVQDHEGRPVDGANVTFYAVDDGIVSLVGFTRPDPGSVFLQPVVNRVLTGLSLVDLLPEDPADLEFSNKGYLIGGGGNEGPVALRDNFPGTACWLPSLVTGADGRVKARFTAPDALTRYRLVAVAAAGPEAFGSGESSVEISKPLMILPSLGRFANEGDDLLARAVIRNETGTAGDVEVTLVSPSGTQKKTVTVGNGASSAADFTLAFAQPGEIALEWTARLPANGQTFSDGAKTRLRVGSPMVRLKETYFAELAATTNNLLDGVNPQVLEGRGEATVTVANTRLVSLGEGARYLVEYPYGCAEQKSSSLVPWIVMPVLGPLMPGFARDAEETKKVVDKTVSELWQMQTADGGLGFWPGNAESSLFASAWAGIVLSMTTAPETHAREWDLLLDYLAKSLRGLSPDRTPVDLGDRAFAAYALALAGRAEPAYHEELFRRRGDLPRDARAVLAVAIARSDGPREMAMELLSEREPAPDDSSPFADAARERAIRLAAVTLLEPKGKEIGPLVAEVLKLGSRERMATTQNSAWTLLALAAYRDTFENKQKGPRDAGGTIVAGTETTEFRVSTAEPAARESFAITPGSGASQKLQVDNPAAAPLYGETRFDVYPPLGDQPRQDRGFAVSRSYRKIADDGSLVPAENLRVGDRVIVTLRVESTRPAHFVAVDDPLPSVLEAVNPEFVSRQSGEPAGGGFQPWLSHCEVRADRVLYFCDALPAGAHTFEYLARVRVAGRAAAGATKVEAMYRPERFGLGTIDRLKTEPAPAE